jgi:purine nucleosidase
MDAHAARAVMRSGASVRLVGLDVTLQVHLTREHAAAMAAGGRPFGELVGQCTIGWLDRLALATPGAGRSRAMHDPRAVAAVSHPELLTWAPAHVDVITGDDIGRGVAIADFRIAHDAPDAKCQGRNRRRRGRLYGYLLDHIAAY